jgi:ribosomal protein S18 acetylase RimI-like enzyme
VWARERKLDTIELNVWAKNAGALAFYHALGFDELRYELQLRVR